MALNKVGRRSFSTYRRLPARTGFTARSRLKVVDELVISGPQTAKKRYYTKATGSFRISRLRKTRFVPKAKKSFIIS